MGTWPVSARLLPHALAAADHASRLQADPEATAGLLNRAGRYLWRRAELQAARDAHRRALAIFEAQLGPDHRNVTTARDSLVEVLAAMGEPPSQPTADQ